MAPVMSKFAPKAIKLTHGGNAAFRRPYKPKSTASNDDRIFFFKPKKRLSDGHRARALRLFYVQHDAKEEQVWMRIFSGTH